MKANLFAERSEKVFTLFEPIINRRIRKIFRNHGYKVYLINEFRTSMLCHNCESKCNTFLKRESNGFKPSRRKNDSGVSHPVMQSITERSEKPKVFESCNPKHKDTKTNKKKTIEVWGLTLCENKNCSLIHNRDKNSALNMYKIVKSIYEGNGRPKIYCREIKTPFIPA